VINNALKIKDLLKFLESLNELTHSGLAPILDYKDQMKKEKAILRILENSKLNMRAAFNKWRNDNQILALQESMNSEKKKELVICLQSFCRGSKNNLLRLVLARFLHNARMTSI
jgi:predicted ribonuclease YlaK